MTIMGKAQLPYAQFVTDKSFLIYLRETILMMARTGKQLLLNSASAPTRKLAGYIGVKWLHLMSLVFVVLIAAVIVGVAIFANTAHAVEPAATFGVHDISNID